MAGLGSTWQNPPASFYRTNREPTTAAESVAQVFLGIRIQCARCHNHPFDVWTQDDYYGLSAFFSNVARKELDNVRKDDLDKHEINGDEIIYLAGPPRLVHPRTGALLPPTVLHGQPSRRDEGDNHLDLLADWLTRDNRQFDRNLANRVWFHLLGRGIVEPVDDFRDSNPPANPALLDTITDYFVDARAEAQAAGRLDHEVPDLPGRRDSRPDQPRRRVELLARGRAAAAGRGAARRDLAGAGGPGAVPAGTGLVAGRAITRRGRRRPVPEDLRQARATLTCECERSESTTLAQAFQMINGPTVRRKLDADDNRIARLLKAKADDRAILDELYLAALGREPKPAERDGALQHVGRAKDRRSAWEDITWALLNSKEFLLRH